jgi:hypothetical protein
MEDRDGWPNCRLELGSSATLNLALKVPIIVEKGGTYMGQSCLMRGHFLHTGQYLDRGLFVFST